MIHAKPFELKSVQISDSIHRDVGLMNRIERATEVLRRESPPSAELVDARWESPPGRRDDRRVILQLNDSFGASVSRELSEEELNDESPLSNTFVRLWGDLLQERSHLQLAKLRAAVAGLEDEDG